MMFQVCGLGFPGAPSTSPSSRRFTRFVVSAFQNYTTSSKLRNPDDAKRRGHTLVRREDGKMVTHHEYEVETSHGVMVEQSQRVERQKVQSCFRIQQRTRDVHQKPIPLSRLNFLLQSTIYHCAFKERMKDLQAVIQIGMPNPSGFSLKMVKQLMLSIIH